MDLTAILFGAMAVVGALGWFRARRELRDARTELDRWHADYQARRLGR